LCPTFIEIDTNKGLYLHRTPGDIRNGHYYVDYDRKNLIEHYSSVRTIDLEQLKSEYLQLLNMSKEEVIKNSPLKMLIHDPIPKYYSTWANGESSPENVRNIIYAIKDKPYWSGLLPGVASEYVGFGTNQLPDEVISSWSYIRNMTTLIRYLNHQSE
jgi:hypothetical protein